MSLSKCEESVNQTGEWQLFDWQVKWGSIYEATREATDGLSVTGSYGRGKFWRNVREEQQRE